MSIYAELELSLSPADGDSYLTRLRVRRTDSTVIDPPPGAFHYDQELQTALIAADLSAAAYGLALGRALLSGAILGELDHALGAAEAYGGRVRLSLQIDRAAAQLQALRWETLCHPVTQRPLATDGRVLFSRFLSSASGRTVPLRPRGQIRAVAAVAAPHDAQQWGLAPIDAEAELQTARMGFAALDLKVLGGARGDTTRDTLLEALRPGVDVLYLVAHGGLLAPDMFEQLRFSTPHPGHLPCLYLEGPGKRTAPIAAHDLGSDLAQLPMLPRLAILIACRSAAVESTAALAWLLGEAGVPAVIAMLGDVSIDTAHTFVRGLLQALQHDEPIDAAVAAGRAAAITAGHTDWWMPALFSRIGDGQLWQADDQSLRPAVMRWLHAMRPQLSHGEVGRLAAALLACPGTARLPLADLPDFEALCVELHFWDADRPQVLVELDAVLHELGLLPAVPWDAIVALQKHLAEVQLGETDIDYLYGRCRPAVSWEKPLGRGPADTLARVVRQLATAPVLAQLARHPLNELVRQLLAEFPRQTGAVADQLRAWESMARVCLGLAPDPGPAADPPPRPTLVVQLSLAPGEVAPDLERPETVSVIMDAWLLPQADQPLVTRQGLTLDQAPARFAELEQHARLRARVGPGGLSVEFLLPLELLAYDVDQWPVAFGLRRQRPIPVGRVHPVVVRSLDRLLAVEQQTIFPLWQQRWQQRLAMRAASLDQALVLIDNPTAYRFDVVQAAVLRRETIMLLQTAPVAEGSEELLALLDTAIAAGLPALLLVRGGCPEPAQTAQLLRAELMRRLFDALPWLAQEQRIAAASSSNHYGDRLTLLYDDPEHIPPLMTYSSDAL
ncbi:MAG: CHAT domain-containing protein [Chloroflexales bacterium]|nr:CHAT domain-containing protein [Chloroflexales bacterium]